VFGSFGGIAVTVVAPFGYYPTTAWWGVAIGLITTTVPAAIAWQGGNLLQVGLSFVAATIAINIPFCMHLAYIIRRTGLHPVRPSAKLALRNLYRSQVLTVQGLFEMIRQQGVRLVLAPLSGTAAVAGFSTMRTGANVAFQGLQSITNPLLPELMRFVAHREQEKTKAALATVWFVLAFALVPAALLVQLVVEPVFGWWTQYKIEFDPLVFGLLTTTVLVFALAQPAMAIVNGNNLLRPQLVTSVLAGCMTLVLMLILVPWIGLRGAAIALLLGELVSASSYALIARGWLTTHDLQWPAELFHWTCASVVVGATGILSMAVFPAFKLIAVALSLIVAARIAFRFWHAIPLVAQQHFDKHARRLILWRRAPQSR
jgi:O-antigen/teichoic acid export membrane protein